MSLICVAVISLNQRREREQMDKHRLKILDEHGKMPAKQPEHA